MEDDIARVQSKLIVHYYYIGFTVKSVLSYVTSRDDLQRLFLYIIQELNSVALVNSNSLGKISWRIRVDATEHGEFISNELNWQHRSKGSHGPI